MIWYSRQDISYIVHTNALNYIMYACITYQDKHVNCDFWVINCQNKFVESNFSFSDINVTVLPTPDIVPLSSITVVCNASKLQGPVRINIYLGEFLVEECSRGASECVYILESFFPFLSTTFICTATNNDDCRFNIANSELVELIGQLR